MSNITKKLILIILFIIISIGLAFLLYFIFFASKNEVIPIGQKQQQTQGGEFPVAGSGSGQKIGTTDGISVSSDIVGQDNLENQIEASGGVIVQAREIVNKNILKVKDYSNPNQGIVYYDDINQSFYKVSDNGVINKLSDRKFYAVKNATFSSTKNQAIIEYPDNKKVLYDFDKDEFIARFPEEAIDFGFSNDGDKLSYKWIDYYENNNYLVTSNPDASNFKFIRPIVDQAKNIDNVWSPDGEIMATFRKQYDLERQEVYFINENNKDFRSLLVDGVNFKGVWNTKGDKILYSVAEVRKNFLPMLWIANGQSDGLGYGKMSLGISTWVDKCSFSKKEDSIVYCAVPDELPRGSGLNPDIVSDVVYSIYKINMQTGNSEIVSQPIVDGDRVSIDKIYITQNDSSIFYTDSANGYLYQLGLE